MLIFHFEIDVFDQKRPDIVAKAISIKVTLHTELVSHMGLSLYPSMSLLTLKFNLVFTRSASTSVMDLSKAEMTFIAV